ncbi:UNVERIFIED_CONTAM: hypothetical protein RMT77_011606 [Armadillidium vulgare]
MSSNDFEYLLQKISPYIAKKDTRWRKAIPAKERLAITLRFLATGDSFRSLHYLCKFSPQLISTIIPEVCTALIKILKDSVKIPSTSNDWKSISYDFENQWNFPNCIGALDGKHIVLQSPVNSGSEFYNYKRYFSIVLMTLVDANCNFIFVDCGCQGRLGDSAVYRNTELFKKVENGELNLPRDEVLKERNKCVPYVFVGDDAFALSNQILKPYPGTHAKGTKERIFNYRLSRARRVVENAFGILASVFRVLRKPMLLQPQKASLVTMTCVVLHNFLRKSETSCSTYSPIGTVDIEEEGILTPGSWRHEQDMSSLLPLQNIPRKSSYEAKNIRDEFAEYFTTVGKVAWQHNYS